MSDIPELTIERTIHPTNRGAMTEVYVSHALGYAAQVVLCDNVVTINFAGRCLPLGNARLFMAVMNEALAQAEELSKR